MLFVRSNSFSYLSILPSELREELLLLLPPKEIDSKDSDLEDFERIWNRETFWEKVWKKWVSPRLPNSSTFPIREVLYRRVAEAKGLTPEQLLIEGSMHGILFYVSEALERGANVHFGEDYALYLAAVGGFRDIVFYLVESGAKISAADNAALRWSAYYGHFEIVKYLVEKGASISSLDNAALRWAAANGHLSTAVYLVENGANVSARDNEALRDAAAKGYLDIVKCLVKSGANVSARNNEALRKAAANGHRDVVKYLIASGANPSVL